VVAVGQAGSRFVSNWARFARECEAELAVEVILVHGALSDMPEETDALCCLSCPEGTTIPRLRAEGVMAARAPIVALTESFCRPGQGWARAIIEARDETDSLAIGGPISRESGSRADWALTFVEYGRFMSAGPSGPIYDLSLVNVSYERERFISVMGEGVRELSETHVHSDLLAKGEALWLDRGAVMLDDNCCSLGSSFRALFHHGRLYGGGRVDGSSAPVRLFRCAVSPLVPLVQFARIRRAASSAGHAAQLLHCFPQLSLLLVAFAAGEAIGSLLGAGESAEHWS